MNKERARIFLLGILVGFSIGILLGITLVMKSMF